MRRAVLVLMILGVAARAGAQELVVEFTALERNEYVLEGNGYTTPGRVATTEIVPGPEYSDDGPLLRLRQPRPSGTERSYYRLTFLHPQPLDPQREIAWVDLRVLGHNERVGVSIVLAEPGGVDREVFLGYLDFDGMRTMTFRAPPRLRASSVVGLHFYLPAGELARNSESWIDLHSLEVTGR